MTAEIAIVVGQGYVGLPLAMRAVEAGYDVIGYDVDEHRSKALAAGASFVEDISDAEVGAALATGRYRATSTLEGIERFDVAVIELEHGEWLTSIGREDEAEPLLDEARETFERLRAAPWLERVDRVGRAAAEPAGVD